MTDDNFFVGVLFRGEREPFHDPVAKTLVDLSTLESTFEVCIAAGNPE